MSVCLSGFYPFVSNKRQNGSTEQPTFFVGPRVIPGKVYRWSNFQKVASIKILFLKIKKIHEIFIYKICKIFFGLFYNLYKENKFTMDMEDGNESSEKPSKYILCLGVCVFVCKFVSNKRENDWTDRFCLGPNMTPGKRIMNAENWIKFCPESFWFLLNSKNAHKTVVKSANFILLFLSNVRKYAHR